MTLLQSTEKIPFVPWSEFFPKFGTIARQGDHGSFVAPTQVGKTTVCQAVVQLRRFVAVLGAKVQDPALERYQTDFGYRRIAEWPPPASLRADVARELVWPKIKVRDDIDKWKWLYAKVLNDIFSAGRWTVVLDDAIMLEERLKLRLPVQDNLFMGGNLVTIYSLAQRPAFVTKFTWSASSWAFLGRFEDDEDARSLSNLGGVNAKRIRTAMMSLDARNHELLFVDARAGVGELIKTKVDLK
jgi:hypothetical protein